MVQSVICLVTTGLQGCSMYMILSHARVTLPDVCYYICIMKFGTRYRKIYSWTFVCVCDFAMQERLRLPSRIPPEDAMKDLHNYTVKSIGEVDMEHCDRVTFLNLCNLVCSRLTMFNTRHGGEPSRMTMDQRWLNQKAMCDLTTPERALFQLM